MSFVRSITDLIFNELKAILRDYTRETEIAIKRRLRRLVITGIIIGGLSALMISFLGLASLFLEIGGLNYLMTFMPVWKAWEVMGLISAVIGGIFVLAIYSYIKKQFGP